jgi:hypothetical protein
LVYIFRSVRDGFCVDLIHPSDSKVYRVRYSPGTDTKSFGCVCHLSARCLSCKIRCSHAEGMLATWVKKNWSMSSFVDGKYVPESASTTYPTSDELLESAMLTPLVFVSPTNCPHCNCKLDQRSPLVPFQSKAANALPPIGFSLGKPTMQVQPLRCQCVECGTMIYPQPKGLCLYAYVCVYMCVCVYFCVCVSVCVCECVCAWVYLCVCV